MKVDGIKGLPQKALTGIKKGVDSVGKSAINAKNTADTFIKNHAQNHEFTKKPLEFFEGKVGDLKGKLKEAKLPEFMTKALNFVKEHKETFAGGAVIAVAAGCAAAIIGTLCGKINEAKNQSDLASNKSINNVHHAHQG